MSDTDTALDGFTMDTDGDGLSDVRWVRFGLERGVRVLALLFVLALVVAACGDDSTDTTGPNFPTGRLVGESRVFEFNADGTFGFFLTRTSDDPAVEGTYSVDGDLYTEMTSDFAGCPFPGTYTWTYEGENLAFHLVGEDACGARVAAYDGQTFTSSQ